jgi:hypothetical protein
MVTIAYDTRTVRLRLPVIVIRRTGPRPRDRVMRRVTVRSSVPGHLDRTRAAAIASDRAADRRREEYRDRWIALRAGAGV